MNKLPFERTERKVIAKKDSKSNAELGCKPEERTAEELIDYGIVNVDKCKGPTSHQVSSYVKNILGIKRAGHSGTLDPGVTGVLPIALGRATRIVQTLLKAGKEYVCIMHLHKEVDKGKLGKVFKKFTGKIKQVPPVKSAVKREEREREIYYFDVLEIEEKDVLFKVGCQAGTYIRKLCFDIGKELGCGAHMAQLRRTKAGPLNEDSLVTLQELKDAYFYWKEEKNDKYIKNLIRPVELGVKHLPKVWVSDSAVAPLCHGFDLALPGVCKLNDDVKAGDSVAVMTLKDELIALGEARLDSKDIINKGKGIAVKVRKVFMEPGLYPKLKKLNST
ncbi:RNA-guided pseudouridylation complex pseudouridine synthase subunit Cbf5 [Candidatus Woesearchaeota archaeon]|nr:RNA-guided pseudouridylation complex pseudouridine synthase subunit Cbf5 [Candidatus Woesearchaeota archaeon]|tara:strand:- start:15630 stop:16628 length:999 start_codon:yes stop_codon:yes gene_type:complete